MIITLYLYNFIFFPTIANITTIASHNMKLIIFSLYQGELTAQSAPRVGVPKFKSYQSSYFFPLF